MKTVEFSVDGDYHSTDDVGIFATDPTVMTAKRGDKEVCASFGASDLL